MKKLVTLAAGLALAAGISTTAQAQQPGSCSDIGTGPRSCSLTATVKVTVPTIIKMDIADTVTSVLPPTAAMFDAGSQDVPSTVDITVKSNSLVTLQVSSSAGWNTVGTYTKATADLQWNVDGGATYNDMTSTAATVTVETAAGQHTHNIGYKIKWDYANDVPGSYAIPVVYTATAP